jgi:hypothetical protein
MKWDTQEGERDRIIGPSGSFHPWRAAEQILRLRTKSEEPDECFARSAQDGAINSLKILGHVLDQITLFNFQILVD